MTNITITTQSCTQSLLDAPNRFAAILPQARHKTVMVDVGGICVGGGNPVVVQSMTNTDTADVEGTAQQCFELWQAGSEIIRITVNNPESAQAVPHIYKRLTELGWEKPVLVGDFHYIGHQLLSDYPECAQALAKYRINPGNVGFKKKHDTNFATMIQIAIKYNKPVRIGVNWGSLDQDLVADMMDENSKSANPKSAGQVTLNALLMSAINSAEYAQKLGLPKNKIIISIKVSKVQELIEVYTRLASVCDYALHLGLTEAGMDSKGVVGTTAALSMLLQQGIGDTIRASLTPAPGGDRRKEVQVCQEILQSLDLRAFMPMVTACPGCGRTTSTVFQSLAQNIQNHVREKMPQWKKQYPGVENLKLAVMGCVVNGPGESKHADIGISLPGTGETPAAPIFMDGKKFKTLRGNNISGEFMEIIENYIHNKYQCANLSSEAKEPLQIE